jgi:glyoxylase-like metal-dependent hydrolase (beta-lactamase superfamily II)
MNVKTRTRVRIAAAIALVLMSSLAACGPKEEILVEPVQGENVVQTVSGEGANIYLIETESGHILVDTGMPFLGKKLDGVFEDAGVDPKSVQLIVLTHGHLDHVGSVAYAKQVTGGKVLCHRSLAENLQKSNVERAVPQTRRIGARLMNALSNLLKFTGVEPDIVVDDEFDLSEYGVAGKIIHTPGHSASSLSIVLENGEALVGDMVREEQGGEIGLGAFYEDAPLLIESLTKVAALEPTTIYLSHGSTIDNRALQNVIVTVQESAS